MEIFQTIWTALTTPNEGLISILSIPLLFIEATVAMLLFTTILNVNARTRQKIMYVLTLSTISGLSNFLFRGYSMILVMLLWPVIIMSIFKISFLKSIVAEIISFFSIILSESLFLRIYLYIFNITTDIANTTPIYRISFALIMYLFIYILYRLAKCFNFNVSLLDTIDNKSKLVLTFNIILGIITIFVQNYLNSYYSDIIPVVITLLSTLTLLTYFFISIYSLTKTTQLQITTQNLEEAQLYNKSLKILHDNVRAFKHDFSNIVQSIGRICSNK